MESLLSAPGAGAANMTDAGTSLGNEIGLGNLSAIQHTAPAQAEPVLPGSLFATAATVAVVFSYHRANLAAALRSGQVLANGAGSCRVPGWWLLGLGGVADGSLI